jgi:hypothetical protein
MNPVVPLAVAALVAVVAGLFSGLYALATRRQRQNTREIREGAAARGWRYKKRGWLGDPAFFVIEGPSPGAASWTLKTMPGQNQRIGFSVRLGMRFPVPAGATDVAILPRSEKDQNISMLAQQISPEARARIAAFSSEFANLVDFGRDAHELSIGLPEFDAQYKVLVTSQTWRPFVNTEMAERLLKWPPSAVQPVSVFAWRDPFGFHFQAVFRRQPNWTSVSYLVDVGEQLASRLPSPSASSHVPGLADGIIARFLN